MKKSILLLALIISTGLFAQEGVLMTFNMQENKTYTTDTSTKVSGTIDIMGSEEMIEAMKSQGMELPMEMKSTSTIKITNQTGTKDDNGDMGMVIDFVEMKSTTTMSGKEIPTPQNPMQDAKIYARFTKDMKTELDSIQGGTLDQNIEAIFKSAIEQFAKSIDFPEEPLQIGSSFENKMPFNVPMGNMGAGKMEMKINTQYTLKKLEGDLAYFDIDQELTMDASNEALNMKASGSGKGFMEFNIKEKYFTKYDTTLPMNMEMDGPQGMRMKMDMQVNSAVITSIE
jgi:hypothetical protein